MNWLGLDIGGANIKAASSDGKVFSTPFRFWIEQESLNETLADLIQRFPDTRIAATMTAELADCFESRKQGVHSIVDCLSNVCSELGLHAPIFAGTDLQFRCADEAKQSWLKTAASNWAMLASYASRHLPQQTGLVIDLGSTTTDIIPVRDGKVIAKGMTDSERLRNGELVYVGVDRTPVCSVIVHCLSMDPGYQSLVSSSQRSPMRCWWLPVAKKTLRTSTLPTDSLVQ